MEKLPHFIDIETIQVLKKLTDAHKNLAELKGLIKSLQNENIILDTLALKEAKDSSTIENIISTMAEIYQSNIFTN